MTADRIAEAKRLAHARTLEYVARRHLAAVPDNDPRRAEAQRKMRDFSATLRAREAQFAETER